VKIGIIGSVLVLARLILGLFLPVAPTPLDISFLIGVSLAVTGALGYVGIFLQRGSRLGVIFPVLNFMYLPLILLLSFVFEQLDPIAQMFEMGIVFLVSALISPVIITVSSLILLTIWKRSNNQLFLAVFIIQQLVISWLSFFNSMILMTLYPYLSIYSYLMVIGLFIIERKPKQTELWDEQSSTSLEVC